MNDWDAKNHAANAVDYLVNITSEGLSYAREDVSGMPAVMEFDPGSAVADRFLNSFFRI
jgi:hypothetical protein